MILDLCGGSGAWSKPYRDAGLEVRLIDTREGWDVRLDLEYEEGLEVGVEGILAAPPCTVFAHSGARWPRSRGELLEGLSMVDACLRMVVLYQPHFWALENPVGKLRRWLGPPRLMFDPCDYGDPYTKRTLVWGDFHPPKKSPVEPVRSVDPKRSTDARSVTPEGFARAFFEANH